MCLKFLSTSSDIYEKAKESGTTWSAVFWGPWTFTMLKVQTGYCQFFIFLIFLFINVSMVAEAARSRRKPRWLLNTNVCFGAAIRFVMFHLNLFIFNICDTNRMKHLQHDCDLWVTRHLPAVMLSLTYLPKKERKKCSKQSYRCIWLLAL